MILNGVFCNKRQGNKLVDNNSAIAEKPQISLMFFVSGLFFNISGARMPMSPKNPQP